MRLRGIGPEVLLLCFLVVGVAAFVLGRRSVRARRVRGDTEYFAGLDHLVALCLEPAPQQVSDRRVVVDDEDARARRTARAAAASNGRSGPGNRSGADLRRCRGRGHVVPSCRERAEAREIAGNPDGGPRLLGPTLTL